MRTINRLSWPVLALVALCLAGCAQKWVTDPIVGANGQPNQVVTP